jgi:hypothetical protein
MCFLRMTARFGSSSATIRVADFAGRRKETRRQTTRHRFRDELKNKIPQNNPMHTLWE